MSDAAQIVSTWIVEAGNGNPLRRVQCVAADVAGQVGAGQLAVSVAPPTGPLDAVWWNAGAAAWVARGAQATAGQMWDKVAHAWVDSRTLVQIRAAQWSQVRAGRDAQVNATFVWSGSTFDCDPVSQMRIIGAVQMALQVGANFTIDWTLSNNTVRTLSMTDMVNLGMTMGKFVGAVVDHGRRLREQIQASTTASAVAATVWTPATIPGV